MPCIVKLGAENMRLDDVMSLLAQTYWASARTRETVQRSIDASLCCGAFDEESGRQLSFARVVTDGATMYYLCDVIVDENHRGQGLARMTLDALLSDERLRGLRGHLITRDAFGLYKKYGFERGDRLMFRP